MSMVAEARLECLQSQAAATEEKTDSGLRIAWQYRRYLEDKQKIPVKDP